MEIYTETTKLCIIIIDTLRVLRESNLKPEVEEQVSFHGESKPFRGSCLSFLFNY